ncbi:MAG: DUF374 domain-containing protein [Elusimicrobia bacterium]|nr:DUF374 domain-containing protein [Elusimicrobiota bacterium]MBD3412721.1 DUF374 domain-containing protein [Elusimicrobiota bacterium]
MPYILSTAGSCWSTGFQNILNMVQVLIPFLGFLYIRCVAATSRIITVGLQVIDDFKKDNQTFIYALWHGKQFFLSYARRMDPVDMLISESKDGELIARTIKYFGMGSVRGSSSRGGARALIRLKQHLEHGRLVGLTPDGPKGPLHAVQPGIIYLAQKTKRPIIPITFAAKRKKIFNQGWDEYHVPYPFNRIVVMAGTPLIVRDTQPVDDAARTLEKQLNLIDEQADRLASEG